ncbi:MAG TPA: hypothetical protein GXZ90_03940 [Clostridiales bacterium]|nr:hypothetical protein [Clostridiales bacterium]
MKCFYHNDLDGRCAGSIVAQYTGNYNSEDYIEVDYAMKLPLDKIQDGEDVWFVDYSFKKDTKHILFSLQSKGCNVIWIDHHTSSINLENDVKELKGIKGVRQEGLSGAILTYLYVYNCQYHDVPYYIKLVSDYDCWQYKYGSDTTYFKLAVEAQYFDALDNIWKILYKDSARGGESYLFSLLQMGSTIKSYIDKDNKYYREHFAYKSEIAGYKCLVVNKKTNSWVFGDKYNEYPIVMVWVFDGIKYTYSIFSSDSSIDCSKIAEGYGGGGHKGAAGFSSEELLFKKI